MLLRDIVELVCAPQITKADVAFLNVLIEEYLEGRNTLFSNTKMRPKHHYLRHYPSLIMHFGPLVRLWTMRFESKHSYFKRCICNSPNFKNVCLTLAEKHQLLQAYKCAGSYFPCDVEAKQSVPLFVDTFSDNIQVALSNFHFDTASQTKIARVGQIILSGILPVFGNRIDGYRNSKRMAINGMMKRLCKEEDVGYVDLWDSFVRKEDTVSMPTV